MEKPLGTNYTEEILEVNVNSHYENIKESKLKKKSSISLIYMKQHNVP